MGLKADMKTPAHSSFAAGGTRHGLMVGRSALQADCTAMLGPRSRRRTRCAQCVRCARTAAASWITKRAEARRPRACASRRPTSRPCRVPPAALAALSAFVNVYGAPAEGRAGRSQRAYAAPRSAAAVAARASAPRKPTRRICSSEANAVSEVSYATGDGREHRRGVGATRRPPQWCAEACPRGPLPLGSPHSESRNGF
jgi:hypothetical protein